VSNINVTPSVSLVDGKSKTPAYLELLEKLVRQESPTRDEAANLELADFIQRELEVRGGVVERVLAPGLGCHLVARFAGPKNAAGPLLILGHMDTVHPVGMIERIPFIETEGRLSGPGVYDMKAGITGALIAMDCHREKHGSLPSAMTFLITCDEEIGSDSSRSLIEGLAKESRASLILEPCVPGGKVKTRRKGVAAYEFRVKGKASHAGIEPEAGASAVHEIAQQMAALLALANDDVGTTINLGILSGGTKENVVAEDAMCSVDVRFWSAEEAERVDVGIRALAAHNPRCSITLTGGINRYPLERTEATGVLFEKAREAAAHLGFELPEGSTGGGSDGNLTAAAGCPTLDGLGPDGGGAHALHEHILVSEIPRRISLMAALYEVL